VDGIKNNLIFGDVRAGIAKLEMMSKAGADKLHAVLDFDRTLTPSRNQEGKDVSTWKLLNSRLPGAARSAADELYKKYRPMELSGKMTAVEAAEWWSSCLNLYKGGNLKWLDLVSEVEETIPIRPGVKELFDVCGKKAFPRLLSRPG